MSDKFKTAVELFWYGPDTNYTDEQLYMIARVPVYAYVIAAIVRKGRWPEAEKYIMKDPYWAVWYALEVINGPWPEAEPYIKEDSYMNEYYCEHFKIKSDIRQ